MPAFASPPLDDPTVEAWCAYADWLYEEGVDGKDAVSCKRYSDWLQALRYAEGLRRRPKLLLSGIVWDEPDYLHPIDRFFHPGSLEWLQARNTRWLIDTDRTADQRRFLATPLDFPEMINGPMASAALVRAFYRKVCYDITVFAKDGEAWVRNRGGQARLKRIA